MALEALPLLLVAGVVVAAGDLALAYWSRAGALPFLVAGLALNLVGIGGYALTLRLENVGVATGVFLGLNILAVTLGGVVLLGENLSAPRAILLAVLAASIVAIELVR